MILTTNSAQNLHILKTINILMPKVHKTCIYSKKSKNLIVKSHQTCIYSKKWKTNSSMPVSPTWSLNFLFIMINSLNIRFGDFSLSKCLIFLSICRFEGLEVQQTCIYSKKINILMPKVHKTWIYSKKSKKKDSEKSPNLHIIKKIKKKQN